MDHKVAFRCRHCGHLHESQNAGERNYPTACCCCGKGVEYTTEPDLAVEKLKKEHGEQHSFHKVRILDLGDKHVHKVFNHLNWEVLHSATDERLAELGLTREDVEEHVPRRFEEPKEAKLVEASVNDGPGSQDKVEAS